MKKDTEHCDGNGIEMLFCSECHIGGLLQSAERGECWGPDALKCPHSFRSESDAPLSQATLEAWLPVIGKEIWRLIWESPDTTKIGEIRQASRQIARRHGLKEEPP